MAESRGRTGDTGRVGDTGRTGDTGEAGGVGQTGLTGAAGKTGKEGPRSGRGLLWTLVGAAVILLLVVATMSTVTLLQQSTIERNSERIAALSKRTAEREARDVAKLREAAWRGCQRDQLERADAYANQRQSLKSPQVREVFSEVDIDKIVARRQKLLPLFNCDPNMCDRSATILSARQQEDFVDSYIAGRLPPDPEPPEVDCTPDG